VFFSISLFLINKCVKRSISLDFLEPDLAKFLNFSEWDRATYHNIKRSVNIVEGKKLSELLIYFKRFERKNRGLEV
jgi:hypothetical protein